MKKSDFMVVAKYGASRVAGAIGKTGANITKGVDKVVETFSPERAVARSLERKKLELINSGKSFQRSFEAISGGRKYYDFLSESKSPDSAIAGSIEKLKQYVRQVEHNNGFVAGAIQTIAENVVGTGFRFQSALKPTAKGIVPKINETQTIRFNVDMERVFNICANKIDIRLMMPLGEIASLVEQTLVRDNEVLVIGRNSKRRDRIIPYCLETLEADRLSTPADEITNPKIHHGIEYDDEGVPKTAFVLKMHPGETFQSAKKRDDYEEIPFFNLNGTRKVMHLFNPIRPEQTRGFTKWAAALKDVLDLERYMDAEKLATLQDACTVGVHYTENPMNFAGNFGKDSGKDDYDRITEIAPGANYRLRLNDKFELHRPTRPNDRFGEYVDNLLRGVASALNVPVEVITRNWKGFNFSNARTVLLQFYLTCRIRQAYLIYHFYGPIFENVLTQAISKGKVQAPNYDRYPHEYHMAHSWILPGWQWVDPLKEAQGKETELNMGSETLTDICMSKGKDIEEQVDKRGRELQLIKQAEEKYGVEFPKQNPSKPAGNESDDDDEENENESRSILSLVRN